MAAGNRNTGEGLAFAIGRSAMPIMLMVIAGSLLALLTNAFSGSWRYPSALPSSWTIQHWANSLSDLSIPFFNTVLISVSSTLLALILVVATLESERQSAKAKSTAMWLLYLPLLIPQLVFLFGIIVLTEFAGWQANLGLVIFGHLLFVLPYVFLSLSGVSSTGSALDAGGIHARCESAKVVLADSDSFTASTVPNSRSDRYGD